MKNYCATLKYLLTNKRYTDLSSFLLRTITSIVMAMLTVVLIKTMVALFLPATAFGQMAAWVIAILVDVCVFTLLS